MSAPEALTERERQLLAAVSQVLDIPNPRWQDRDHFEAALRERVYRLLGALDNLDEQTKAVTVAGALERIAALPLRYELAPEDHSP